MNEMKLVRVKLHTVLGIAYDTPTEFYFNVFSNCGHQAGLSLDYEEMCQLKEAVDSAMAEYDKFMSPAPVEPSTLGKCSKCGHEHPSIIGLCMACTNKKVRDA